MTKNSGNEIQKALWVSVVALVLLLIGSWWWFYSARPAQPSPYTARDASAQGRAGPNAAPKDPYKDEAVRNTLRKSAPDVQKLWLDYLASQPKLTEGTVELDWQIDSDGKVLGAALVHSELGNPTLEQGLVRIVQGLHFPPPPGGARTYIAHKFRFKKTE